MNIGQIMRGLMGESASGDVKAMELKVGQVVRGVVLQTFDNNEALVQINGVQVRAKLEMPLTAGQSAILQVQPESNGSLIVMKAVDPSQSGLMDDTFKEFAKMLGLPDQRWALEIVKDLRREGFLFNRTTAKAFQEAALAKPTGVDLEQWMTAAAATFKRGLPMTQATIASMSQTMFGKSVHELLDSLQSQLKSFVSAQSGGAAADEGAGGAQAAGNRVLALLEQGAAMLRGGFASQEPEQPAPPVKASGTVPIAVTDVNHGGAKEVVKAAIAGTGNQEEGRPPAANESGQTAANGAAKPVLTTGSGSANWLSGMMKWMGVDHEHQLAKAATATPSPHAETLSANGAPAADAPDQEAVNRTQMTRATGNAQEELTSGGGERKAVAAPEPQKAANTPTQNANVKGEAPAGGPTASAAASGNVQGSELGARQAVSAGAFALPGQLMAMAEISTQPDAPVGAGASVSAGNQAESLKSALLSLISAGDTPQALKETAQQMVNQITGQQLLLTPERNNSVFTHVTMFIPFQNADGESTASVHIQTRRGKRGELDAENCRLLFNLTMSSLGDTLVDVNVADKIVSLNIWNDHPAISELVESSRTDIAERLQETGYQLSSLRTTPLPTRGEQEQAVAQPSKGKSQSPPDLSQFASTRYKGVDFRA
ncbi:flagellar hook-length control protein FliK [Paenibacillus soyae]|uniref:Flagellar hook-length control protein FliK n=1 Tax=Paenibacillus soyae TaxID=2969249 RepID=A0A9X2MSE8_9BACL|nr:flagellar hook-length control protein FliK [Paenibacillus soyae]MCR2804993.1 flagellar hook-length control protein FliK [Paenibacillus soyae]